MRPGAGFDPRDPVVHEDPYPVYDQLRDEGALHFVPSAQTWFVSSHELCLAVLRDPRFSARQGQLLRVRSTELPTTMLTSDPPEHNRLRDAVAEAFLPDAVAALMLRLEPLLRRHTAALVAALDRGEEVDVVAAARPVAVAIIAELLGLPEHDRADLDVWGPYVGEHLDPFADPDPDGPGGEAMRALLERLADRLHEVTARPEGDATCLGALARAYAAEQVDAREALSTAALLVVAGLEPLVALVGNSVAALAGGPPPELESRVLVEELLRVDPPIQFTARRATEDVELGGRLVRAGQSVVVLLGAANHDPRVFEAPGRLTERRGSHLAFGAGVHTCPGAPVVRMVAELVVSVCAELDASRVTLGTAPARRGAAVVPRGYARLSVRRVATDEADA